jgi:hypothetical protein
MTHPGVDHLEVTLRILNLVHVCMMIVLKYRTTKVGETAGTTRVFPTSKKYQLYLFYEYSPR